MLSRKTLALVLAAVSIVALSPLAFAQGYYGGNAPSQAPPPQMQPNQMQVSPSHSSDRLGLRGVTCPVRIFMPPAVETLKKMGEELALDEQQQSKMMTLLRNLQQKSQSITKQNQPIRDLIMEMQADPTDTERIQRLVAQVAKQEESLLQAEVDMWMSFEKLLTPEQNQKFWDMFLHKSVPTTPPQTLPMQGMPPMGSTPAKPRTGNR